LKLHPREWPEDYGFSGQLDPPIPVVTHAELPDLVAACDLFVSSSSSTVLLAMMLDRPIVTVNFNQIPHFDYFEPLGGALHTRSPAEFARALPLALSDEPTRARLARERRTVLDRYTRFDGQATERLAGLIVGAITAAQRRAARR
jgi:spore coat polysaccharide biosynthesis predicted glycosyltransferase SpsG